MRVVIIVALMPALHGAPLGAVVMLNNGVKMPTVSLGTWFDGGSDPSVGLPPWLKAGGTGIDTAFDYNVQGVIGKVLKEKSIPRESVFITSKIPAGFGNDTDCNVDPSIAVRYAKENLRQLQIDYLDLLLIHVPCQVAASPVANPRAANAALWKGMTQALSMNLTRAIGVSNFDMEELEDLPAPIPAVNQCPMGPKYHDDRTINYCKKKGILYEAYYLMHNCPFQDSHITSIAAVHNVSASQVCQRYVLDKGIAMAVGTGKDPQKSAQEAVKNLDVYGFHLTDEEFKIVDNMQGGAKVVDTIQGGNIVI